MSVFIYCIRLPNRYSNIVLGDVNSEPWEIEQSLSDRVIVRDETHGDRVRRHIVGSGQVPCSLESCIKMTLQKLESNALVKS